MKELLSSVLLRIQLLLHVKVQFCVSIVIIYLLLLRGHAVCMFPVSLVNLHKIVSLFRFCRERILAHWELRLFYLPGILFDTKYSLFLQILLITQLDGLILLQQLLVKEIYSDGSRASYIYLESKEILWWSSKFYIQ